MTKIRNRRRGAAPVLLTLTALTATAAVAMPPFGDWSAPQNLENAGSAPSLNTPAVDGCVSHTKDGLTIYFNSNRLGTQDIFMSSRASTSEGFGAPVKLPAPVNTNTHDEACPTIQNNRLYFLSTRDDPGAADIMVSKSGPKGWSEPVNIGSRFNRTGWLDETPDFYEDEDGNEVMVYSRRLPNGLEGEILQSVNGAPPSLVQGGPHSSASDNRPSVTRDGLTMFFDSNRSGLGGPDLFYSTRSSTSEAFGPAIHLHELSSPGFDARPYISWDGTLLTFSSNRSGSESAAPDIWFTTREKAVGKR